MPVTFSFWSRPDTGSKMPILYKTQTSRGDRNCDGGGAEDPGSKGIPFGLRHPVGQKRVEHSRRLSDLPAGSPAQVSMTTTKTWAGPHKFISVDVETEIVQMQNGRPIFSSNCEKKISKSNLDHDSEINAVNRESGVGDNQSISPTSSDGSMEL